MGMPSRDGPQELVVADELAEVAERLGVPLHAGERVRFEVIERDHAGAAPAGREPWPPAWVGAITTDDEHLGTRVREVMRTEFDRS